MTHEYEAGNEAPGGPENDHKLPDAINIPTSWHPDDLDPMPYDEDDPEQVSVSYDQDAPENTEGD